MNDKKRAEFEKWARKNADFFEFKQFSGRVRPSGNYACKDEQKAFIVWQAAIASVVVTIPDWSEYDTPRQAIEACVDRIKEAGLNC